MFTADQVLEAIHGALREFRMEIPSLISLNSTQLSSPNLSCVNFAGAILDRLSQNCKAWPPSRSVYPSGLFLNVTLIGEPSEYNHGFCVYFYDNLAYVIQAFLGHKIRLITPMNLQRFNTSMAGLRSGKASDFAAGYQAISTVDISPSGYKLDVMHVYSA